MLHVVAVITAKSGQRDHLLAEFRKLMPIVRSEAGCIEYNATVDVAGASPAFGENVFVVIEKWQGKEMLDAHAAAPHMAEYRAKVGHMVEKTEVFVLDPA